MDASVVALLDVIRSLAFVGDLAMGQPTDHSPRAAWMAGQLARASGADAAACTRATTVALLRWSGCTANAPEFAQLFGDDVNGRKALLATQSAGSSFRSATARKSSAFLSLSRIHCEVSGDIGAQLGLDDATQFALHHLFESYDGSGAPGGLGGEDVPLPVYTASLAGDLDIFNRLYGLDQACKLIGQRAGSLYPQRLADALVAHAAEWLAALESDPGLNGPCSLEAAFAGRTASLEILAHVIDLKLPWMTGNSRQVAQLAHGAAQALGLDAAGRQRVYCAALIHGIGRAAVPNMIWNTPGKLPEAAWERVRLVPYWTARAARQLGSLAGEAELASYAFERLDGSGYYREAKTPGIPVEGRILAAASALAALRSARPWREALVRDAADATLLREATAGRYDLDAVRTLLDKPRASSRPLAMPTSALLTERERDVLRCISLGASNKVAAQKLSISPSTVRTHVESVFRKLECSTRAAAILKAAQLGLL
ncbi:MAG: HD domain-containing phosphohydrolase [Solimonas sp.]